MSIRARVYAFLATLIVVSGGLYFFFQNYELDGLTPKARAETKSDSKKAAKKGDAEEATPVEIESAATGSISSYIRSTANLRALRDVTLMPRIEGVVREVQAEEGDYVKKGAILCLLDDRELQINLDLNKQRLAQTRVQLESAQILREKNQTQIEAKQAEIERNDQALGDGLVSDTDVQLLRNQLAELQHDERAQEAAVRENEYRVEELTAEIESVKVQIEHTRIRAPFSGRVTERSVELGQTVRPSDALFKLAAFDPLFADTYLSEGESRRVRPGQPVEVALGASGDETAAGKVARVSPVVDDATGTVKVTAELRNAPAILRPGAFVRVQILTDTRAETVLIPKRAILDEDGQTYVFVTEDAIAHKREVELGYENGATVEVLSGLEAGAQVVVAGQGGLKEGDKTRTVNS